MDHQNRMDINQLPPVTSEKPWLESSPETMPDWMREKILTEAGLQLKQQTSMRDPLRILVRTLSAACLVLALLFSSEQIKTVHKIKQLENKMALRTGSVTTNTRAPNELLLINRFVSWSELKNLQFHPDPPSLEEHLVPSLLKPNFFGDRRLKEQFRNYLHDIQLATKIYLK